ncbi:hypothetical protein [Mycolicibacterium confluentis]|uniref:Uncharacterized protein n=1 Tax=Mycolicibacterium confluentis TaxID=28047 RepID=A0A7I7Y2S9_9MYCO|nr:hypothetical protein [Mycolicibacterium confluentis]MCV7322935.1 hypothetical protein [Mycolicibacterium confluentis]ORV20694.1 hypothetical protein AWB99_07010 [Mycolicibacterium confluentis]BBZ35937.1 hypothetical protein MCNF_45420 [Mycolicibacterium confluentis]
MNTESLEVVKALSVPIVTGLVTAGGIALERIRSERDLEVRRGRIVEMAHNQIAAVQPLLENLSGDPARERAYAIITAALDSIARAQALSQQPEEQLEKSALKAIDHARRSVLDEVLLRRHLRSRAARVLRVLYYVVFAWACLCVFTFFGSFTAINDADGGVGVVIGVGAMTLVLGLVPMMLLRSMVLARERRAAGPDRTSISPQEAVATPAPTPWA